MLDEMLDQHFIQHLIKCWMKCLIVCVWWNEIFYSFLYTFFALDQTTHPIGQTLQTISKVSWYSEFDDFKTRSNTHDHTFDQMLDANISSNIWSNVGPCVGKIYLISCFIQHFIQFDSFDILKNFWKNNAHKKMNVSDHYSFENGSCIMVSFFVSCRQYLRFFILFNTRMI